MKLLIPVQVAAPRPRVFEVFADLARAPERCSGIEALEILEGDAMAKGTRFRETRVMFGKEAVEEMEVTGFAPPTSYTVEADSCGMHFTSTYHFTDEGAGTLVVLDVQTKANTLAAKLMTPMGLLMRGPMKKAMRKDMEELRDWIEANPHPEV